ncbi:GNAT family N-acetyltransferase [Reyranella sp.]|jgi:predicted N-acetyltransferase YhbS|uniref:GNAT family N-acetyltransferase n=1 Tax=Reyranella sp. TaxID=1929291 RepID=UPI003BACB000
MSDTLVLRTATAGDAAAIASVIAASFEQYRGRLVPESGAFRESPQTIAAELGRGVNAIVAERNGQMLGCVLVEEMEGDLYFGRLSVVPAARGQGLSKRLIAAVEAEAGRRGLSGVRLGVRIVLTDNQRLFQALGYRETSREAHPGFENPTSINMRKPLP